MVHLVLDESPANVGAVREAAGALERALDPHLFPQSALRRGLGRLARPGMAAARVRPPAGGGVLACRSALKQQAARVIEDEHRHGAMWLGGAARPRPPPPPAPPPLAPSPPPPPPPPSSPSSCISRCAPSAPADSPGR